MTLSTFSFSIRVGVFVAVIVTSFVGAELFARNSDDFASSEQWLVKHYTLNDPANAVFGDSQVGSTSYIPGFVFFGTAGQQPAELLRLINYVFATDQPKQAIVEMAPQWFGRYHDGRVEFITDELLPPGRLKLLVLSPYYYRDLKNKLVDHVAALLEGMVSRADAADLSEPPREEAVRLSKSWELAVANHGDPYTFEWSSIPAFDRHRMTLSRVHAQNPRDGFQTGQPAQLLEQAIVRLIDMGAEVCLYRPPVTAEFERLTSLIPGSNYEAFNGWAEALADRLKVPWIRYTDLPMTWSDDYFYNQDHLNRAGGQMSWPLVAQACFG